MFVCGLLASILASAPVLFCGLAEDDFGEMDLTLRAGTQTGYSFLNYTKIEMEMRKPAETYWMDRTDAYDYSTPRFYADAEVFAASECGKCYEKKADPFQKEWKYLGMLGINRIPSDFYGEEDEGIHSACYWPEYLASRNCTRLYNSEETPIRDRIDPSARSDGSFCFSTLCAEPLSAKIVAIDEMKEKKMELGRHWPFVTLGREEAVVGSKIADQMNLKVGDVIHIELDLTAILGGLWNTMKGQDAFDPKWATGFVTLKVQGIYRESAGKFGSKQKSNIVVEYAHFLPYVMESLHPRISASFYDRVAPLDPYHFASQVIFNFPPNRHNVYAEQVSLSFLLLLSFPPYSLTLSIVSLSHTFSFSPPQDADVTTSNGVQFASDVVYRIGVQDVTASMPPIDALRIFRYVSMFFGLMLNVILFILLFLSVLLIYSLLSVSVERKTFSFGILRMTGMLKRDVLYLIVVQPILNSVPAIAIGLLLAHIGTVIASAIFEEMTGIPIDAGLTLSSVIMAVTAAISIPLLASILPIQGALSKSLTDAVDTKRSKVVAVKAEVSRAGGASSLSVELLTFATALVSVGFLLYYLMPLALLSTNVSLLLNIFFGLIVMMLLGLVLLSLNVNHFTEKATVWGLFWWERRGIPTVLMKTLVAHRGERERERQREGEGERRGREKER